MKHARDLPAKYISNVHVGHEKGAQFKEMKMRTYGGMAMMALMLTAGAGSAMADLTYNLTVDNCTGGCQPGAPGTSMGTVLLHQNGVNDVRVTVTLVAPLKFVNTGL